MLRQPISSSLPHSASFAFLRTTESFVLSRAEFQGLRRNLRKVRRPRQSHSKEAEVLSLGGTLEAPGVL